MPICVRHGKSHFKLIKDYLGVCVMGNESGEWIIRGVDWDAPKCIHSVDEAIEYINSVGFLPFFKNGITDFSLEERTASEYWWSGDRERDPWEWRQIIAERGDILYGKFFQKKAGFISREWVPYFANFRRDGYDFDALYEDGKASIRQKRIMDLFMEKLPPSELFSFEIKEKAGFGKGGEKNFDGTISELEMKTYLCVKKFEQKTNKKGERYGWSVAKYAMPEAILGYDYVRKAYSEEPDASSKRIREHMIKQYPAADIGLINKITGLPKEK